MSDKLLFLLDRRIRRMTLKKESLNHMLRRNALIKWSRWLLPTDWRYPWLRMRKIG
jgi:hypothetical protein